MCVSALAVPYLRSVDVSWCKVVGSRLVLLLDALQPAVILELRLSSCELTSDDLRHLGNTHTHTHGKVFSHWKRHTFIHTVLLPSLTFGGFNRTERRRLARTDGETSGKEGQEI